MVGDKQTDKIKNQFPIGKSIKKRELYFKQNMELSNLTKMNLKKKNRKKERKDSKFEIKVTKKKV